MTIDYDKSQQLAVDDMLAAREYRDAHPDLIEREADRRAHAVISDWRDGPVTTARYNQEYRRVLAVHGRIA